LLPHNEQRKKTNDSALVHDVKCQTSSHRALLKISEEGLAALAKGESEP
jgi:hypothetical protein